MTTVTVALAALSLLLAASTWFNWHKRHLAEQRARANAELAAIGSGVNGLAHDLANLFVVMVANLSSARDLEPSELREMLSDVEQAARAAERLVRAVNGVAGGPGPRARPGSLEGVVRLNAALLRRCGVPVDLEFADDVRYRGSDADAMRVVQNLLGNAVRGAAEVRGSRVAVALRAGALRVTNRARDAATLDESIYTQGVSMSGSTGLGLPLAREAAARLGWAVRHEVRGDEVTFVVECEPEPRAN